MTSGALQREFERLTTLKLYHVLESGPDSELDDITRLTAELLGVPICLISISDEHRQWFKSRVGIDVCEVPRKNAFCDYATQGHDLFIVPDARLDERFASHPMVVGELGVRFYAGMPLITPGGEALGALCVVDVVPRDVSEREQRTLKSLGRQVMTRLELVRQMRELEKSQADLLTIMERQRDLLQALGESEQRFRTLVENAPHAIFIQVDGHFVYANKATHALMDAGVEGQLIGQPVREHFRSGYEAALNEQSQTLGGAHPEDLLTDEVLIMPDGTRRHASISSVPFNYNGQEATLVFASNITSRKEAEQKLRQQAMLLDKAQDAIVVQDLDHRVLYWNKSAEKIYGWKAAEALGQRVSDMHLKDGATFSTAEKATLQAEEWAGEMPQVSRGGKSLLVEAQWTLVRDDAGSPTAIMSVNTDITERQLIQKQHLRAQRLESIGTLAGGIAHDLNNVLSPILMSIEVLKLKERDAARLAILSTIERSAARGADMVRQVLTFSRGVESQQLNVKAGQVLAEVEKFARETFPKSIRISCSIPSNLWMMTGDPTHLHQVLLNLCVNARDAMPNGGKLGLSAHNVVIDEHYAALCRDSKPGPHLCLQVEDSGTGMPPEVIEHIFEPFFSTKEVGKGTGLGLSTTLAIVKAHGGFLHVQSQPGEGTTFAVYLPAHSAPEESAAAPVPMPEDLPSGCGESVLVVDDEPSVRDITRHTLESFGYCVSMASDGAEAAAIYASRTTDISVVLIDMMMPVMDGAATIQVLCRLNPAVKIIAASGLNVTKVVDAAATAGTRCFIAKPYTAATLLKALRQVIDEH